MLLEWGSHSIIHINTSSNADLVVTSGEAPHDDPCKTLVVCNNGRREQRVPPVGHDLIPVYSLNEGFDGITPMIACDGGLSLPLSTASALSRPPDPHFHPPQLA